MEYEILSLTPEMIRHIEITTGLSLTEIADADCDELDRRLSKDGKPIPVGENYDSVLVEHCCRRYVSRDEIDRRLGRINPKNSRQFSA